MKQTSTHSKAFLLLLAACLLLLAIPAASLATTMIHNSATTGSTKWGGSWGVAGGQYGEFTCATCHAKSTGNIKRVKKDLVAPNSPAEQFPLEGSGIQVNFMDTREGTSDFGDDSNAGRIADGVTDTTSDKVCEACHTQTKFHNFDATLNAGNGGDRVHYNDADCMICHPHNQGFKPLDCTSCHGYPPANAGELANNPFTTGSATAGAHVLHATTLSYACDNCHSGYTMPDESAVNSGSGDISISFSNFGDATGSYTGQAGVSYNDAFGTGGENCNNVYCHSTGQSADGTSATPSAYSVASWSTPASGACGTCHNANDPGTGSHTAHINDGANCDSCHNDADAAATVPTGIHVSGSIDVYNSAAGDLGYTADGARGNGYGTCNAAGCHDQGRGGLATTPTWGASVTDCTECHEGSGMATGGHAVHLAANIAGTAIDCTDCHDAAADPATETEPAVGHRDDNIDVASGSYPTNKAKNTAFTNCTTATCHQTGQSTNDYTVTSNWGTDDANCTQCHAAVPATGSHDTHVNTAGYNCTSCHTNAIKDTSYNDANHGDVTIDVVVGNYITNRGNAAYGTAYTTCDNISCHGDGLNAGGGNTPTWGASAGCAACHDTVNDGTGSHAVHLTYTSNSCVECHDNADLAGTAPGEHGDGNIDVYNSAALDLGYPANAAIGSGSWSGCTAASCHDDGRSANTTPNWGTAASNACTACHDTIPATGSHASHVADAAVDCTDCHAGAVQGTTLPSAGHDDGNIDTTAAHGYTQNKAKGSAFTNCTTASCHDDGRGGEVTANWGTTINNCAECHAEVPATGGHGAHVGVSFAGSAIACTDCHAGAVQGTTEPSAGHRDGNVDAAGYDTPNKGLGTAFTTCSTASCHQTGQSTNDYVTTSTWGADDANCTQCHAAVPATGSHDTHVNTAGYNCTSCHTNAIKDTSYSDANHGDVTIDVAVGSYITNRGNAAYGTAYTTCNNISCHGDGLNPGGGNTPTWGANAGCAACHSATPTTGSHSVHLADTSNSCVECHDNADTVGETAPGQHGDGDVDVFDSAAGDLGYPQDAAIGSGSWSTCNNASCHDPGRGALVVTPTWNSAVTNCTECHEGAGMATGSHTVHLAASIAGTAIACTDCHDAATDPSTETAPATGHRDNNIDVASGSYPTNKAKNTAFTNCSTATCHQTGQSTNDYTVTSNWGTDDANCTQCHAAVPATGSHDTHVNTAGYNCSSCHTNATKDTSYNDANHGDVTIDVAVGNYITNRGDANYGTAFTTCDNISCHGDGLNPGGANTPTWGANAGCAACHDTVNDGTGSHAVHLTYTGNSCVECHDNADIAGTAPGQHGDGDVDVYNSAALDLGYPADAAIGSASWAGCTAASCHDDGRSANTTPNWGTAASNACTACHDTIPATGSHASHVADAAVACTDCHAGAVEGTTLPSAGHDDGNIDTTAAHGYTQNKAKGSALETCATASCHDDGRNSGLTGTWGTTINNCAECHATTPSTGSHTTHLALYACGTCHSGTTQGTTAGAGHRDGNIDTAASTGLTANKALGTAFTSCGTNNCHGSNSPVWGTDLSANDQCTQCHGELVAGPATDAQKAPGGAGVDTNGDSGATDAQVGAHQVHLNPSMSSAIACTACHTVPTAITDAGHIDSALPAELTWGGLATANSTTPVSCATTYCHDGSAIKNGWDGGTLAPTWTDTNFIQGTVADCDNCHGYPPPAAHPANSDCSVCHNNVTGAGDDSFVDVSQHIDGVVQASGGDNCTDCHNADVDGALNGAHTAHTDTSGTGWLNGKTISGGDYGGVGWYTTTWTNGQPVFGCGECHPAGEGVSHPTAGLNVDIDPAGETPTAGSPKLLNTDTPSATVTTRVSVSCDNVYCHSDALSAGRTYATTPEWYGGTISGNCNDCHANGPSTGTHAEHTVGIHYETLFDGATGLMASSGGAGSGAAHGDAATSDTIGCYTCHNDTVAVEFNDQNNVCATCHDGGTAALQGNMVINTAGSTHVNAQPDVVFSSLASFKSRAQIRDDITTVTELNDNWARNNGYKANNSFDQGKAAVPGYAAGSCSNIACHNGIATPTWNTGFVANCKACHTTLP